ncbi:hypothetical protein LCM20_02385 [Halobacillus litoralis]|uniref:hypothetical protein n=1 Tax=Halobacillus litoralis TaxID=45668 RepID=UPI001CD301F2|nr:hypothetical protein [Halobacillus litoralis]MCA0969437.1 hypothetical protein [Halobacillus litoralis]
MLHRLLIPITAVIILTGCLPQSSSVEVLSAAESDYELFLYTKEGQKEQADHYLNALLDWKTNQSHTQNIEFTQTITKEDQIEVSGDRLPALIVKKQGEIVMNIQGENTSQRILDELEKTFAFKEI